MTAIFYSPPNWTHPAFESIEAKQPDSAAIAPTFCLLPADQEDVTSATWKRELGAKVAAPHEDAEDNAAKGFADYRRAWSADPCLHPPSAGESTGHVAREAGRPLVDNEMHNRIEAYKRVIADTESIVRDDNKPDSMPNPLTVRAWLFNIGLAFGKVTGVLHEIETQGCASREERVEKILQVFRDNDVVKLAANAIQTRLHYDEQRAQERAEQLVRYAFANSISK
jgi:hypothetical protein